MPKHTKRSHARRTVLWVLCAAVLLALCAAAALFFYTPSANRNTPTAQAPTGAVKALAVRVGASGDVLTDAVTQDTLQQQAAAAVAQAKVLGMNTLLLYVQTDDGLLYRDRTAQVLPQLEQGSTLLHPLDGLQAFCDAAQAQDMAVCAVFTADRLGADGSAARASMERMFRKYPLWGVYEQTATTQADGLFYTYTPLLGDIPTLQGIAADGWAQPDAVFVSTVMQQQEGTPPAGYVFDAATALQDSETLGLLLATLDDTQPPVLLGYTPSSQLSVAYPQDGAVLTSASCFVMGTSDSALPLLLNGQPIERTAAGGTFGVLVPLELGQNTLVFSQGGEEIVLTVTRKAASSGTSSGTLPHDSTVEVEPGTMVQVSGWLASLLYNPSGDGNINETVRQGATASVQACVETVRSGKRTWAYQLASGDYILAYNTTILSADTPRAQLNSAAAQANGARGEVLTFSGSGTPLAYTNQVDNTLVLHFYDADFAADFAVTGSAMVKAVSTAPLPDNAGTELVLTFDAPLWGHTLEYQDGSVVLYLKAAPTRAQNPAQPLAGVTVLLDAGHGEDDTGAMGAAGNSAPTEKDVNLAVALAARYRLEQLGATVEMIRTDDTFLSLAARNAKITELQPDFFIAVHHNSIELTADANASGGTECYYFYSSGKELATTLCERVTQATNRTNRGAQWGYYYVTRNTTCPAVLLEVGFMVNPAEYESVTDEATLWRTGAAIAHSVLNCVPQA